METSNLAPGRVPIAGVCFSQTAISVMGPSREILRSFERSELWGSLWVETSSAWALIRFYMRRDILLANGAPCRTKRVALVEITFEDDEFEPTKPRRLYDVTVEEAGCGGGRDG